jgi:hypothetical protein
MVVVVVVMYAVSMRATNGTTRETRLDVLVLYITCITSRALGAEHKANGRRPEGITNTKLN